MALEANTVYFVDSPEDDSVLLALDAKLAHGLVEWFDTTRDRAFAVRSHEDLPDGLSVVTERGTYRLRRLTRELYEAHVKDQVTGHRPFADTAAIQEYYRHFPR